MSFTHYAQATIVISIARTVKHLTEKWKFRAANGGNYSGAGRPNMRIVFLTDVSGIYDKPPTAAARKNENVEETEATLIDQIFVDHSGEVGHYGLFDNR